jgi:hypothetical protein
MTTSELNKFVKETFDPVIRESYGFNCKTLNLFKKQVPTEPVTSIGRYFTIQTQSNQSYGSAATEGGAFPAAGTLKDQKALIGYRSQFKSFGWTGDVNDLANAKTLVSANQRVIKDATEQFDEVQNLFLFGPGDGVLGVIDTVSSNDITMLNTVANSYGAREILAGQLLNAYDQSGAAYRSGDMTVNSVARSTDIVSVDTAAASIATDDDDVLVFKGSYGYAPQGFRYHVADSGTWLGLSRTTFPSLKASVYDASSGSLDYDMLDLAMLRSANLAGDDVPANDFTFITHPCQTVYLKAAGRNSANVQFQGGLAGNKKLDLGLMDVEYNGKRINTDSKCAPSDFWGLRLSTWFIEEVAPRQLYKHASGNVMVQGLAGSTNYADAMEGRVYWRYNIVCKEPFKNFRIKNLNFNTADTRINRQ